MIVLGISGGLSLQYEDKFQFKSEEQHDSAAVLVVNGEIVSAIEEERLNRIKHTNKAPFNAIKFVLKDYGIQLKDVDKVAVYSNEEFSNRYLRYKFMQDPSAAEFKDIKSHINQLLTEINGTPFDDSRIQFVDHHWAHAISTFALSGFDNSLVMTIDGEGNGISGMILKGDKTGLELIQTIPVSKSLGNYYCEVVKHLGYSQFDEYKVMGLAPYGNPRQYSEIISLFYELLPEGDYKINFDKLSLLNHISVRRKKNEPFTQIHKDIAAALQESLEKIVLHVLGFYKNKFGYKNLCLAGGVANNCSMNGKIYYADLFNNIFIQPASHDAGCAIGAALHSYYSSTSEKKLKTLDHVYYGTAVESGESLRIKLGKWGDFMTFEKIENIEKAVAAHLANGEVVGWVQGKSEFGPRALGNRSILADPRPLQNREIINAMVKKRESYRPFAPSILEEYVEDYFEVPYDKKNFSFMTFVLKVRKDKQKILGAITHVDGTARLQSVSKKTNARYWNLIEEFRLLTNIPILLNTSFNNNVEPIIDSTEDAINCFLTTKINYLVIDDFFIKKKDYKWQNFLGFKIFIPLHIRLKHTKSYISMSDTEDVYELECNYNSNSNFRISKDLFTIMVEVNETITINELLLKNDICEDFKKEKIVEKLVQLFFLRMVVLSPL